jgi:hypothetical protein
MDATAHALEPTPAVLAVTMVHGTFPRGLWLQLRRNLSASWSRLCRRQVEEAALWPAPASKPDQRCWFEEGSEFQRDLVRRTGLPPGGIVFDRFLWSGRNTFADRAEAARSLRAALRESAREHPGVPHVVLAHSHGGTVAVKALDTSDAPNVRALLTLATPFVRLVLRWPTIWQTPPIARNLDMMLPFMLWSLAPLMALDLGLRSDGALQAIAAGVVGIAALAAAWRASLIWATINIGIVVGLGGLTLLADLLLLAALFVPVYLFLRVFSFFYFPILERALDRIEFAGTCHVEHTPLCLACPLLALRAPRDEASLVIGLGQVAQGLGHAAERYVYKGLGGAAERYVYKPLGRALGAFWFVLATYAKGLATYRRAHPRRRAREPAVGSRAILLAVMALIGLVVIMWVDFRRVGRVYEWAFATTGQDLFSWALTIMIAGLIGSTVPFVLTFLISALALMGIGLVTGPEAFMQPGSTLVEAEPLPNARAPDGLRRAEMDLEILYNARPAGLNHSLYDAPEVRDRIAAWLREQAGAPAVKREAEEGWGRK